MYERSKIMLRTAKTENGLVRGIAAADPRITAFKGIPFAAPPVGELRWHAPVPAKDWQGVRDCVEFAPISMQTIPGLDKNDIYSREWNVDPEIPMSEDCLYLNIWTPAKSADEKLPVYVWYFGGALQVGNTAEMEFDGERIARRGIVVVTINYRVNVFGFLAHPELTKENPEAPTNFGNLDQQFGLMWTKRNIAAFGGDPDNITIGGQSAGGGSVLTQLNCPKNRPYIQKAVIESGIATDIYEVRRRNFTLAEAEKNGEAFLEFLGVKSIAEARALPATLIRDKNNEFKAFWGTVIDGVYQTDTYWNNMKAGKLLDVPLMFGYTNNEFFFAPKADSMEAFVALAKEKFGEDADQFLALVKADEGLEKALENANVSLFEIGARVAARLLGQCGYKEAHYLYEFGPEVPGWDKPGAFHSCDLWFFFETLAKCWRPFTGKHYDLARQMSNYLSNFIKAGNPNGADADGTPMEHWEPYSEQAPVIMKFYDKPIAEIQKEKPLVDFLIDFKSR
jgi:para-nitrobenzyl esterase